MRGRKSVFALPCFFSSKCVCVCVFYNTFNAIAPSCLSLCHWLRPYYKRSVEASGKWQQRWCWWKSVMMMMMTGCWCRWLVIRWHQQNVADCFFSAASYFIMFAALPLVSTKQQRQTLRARGNTQTAVCACVRALLASVWAQSIALQLWHSSLRGSCDKRLCFRHMLSVPLWKGKACMHTWSDYCVPNCQTFALKHRAIHKCTHSAKCKLYVISIHTLSLQRYKPATEEHLAA